MGRKISQNRRISSDRVRKIRKRKSKILIALEGKNKTEKIYFSNFEDGKKSYNISYAKGNNTDPLKLVEMLIKEIENMGLDLQDDDIAYCIFDTDTNPDKNKIITLQLHQCDHDISRTVRLYDADAIRHRRKSGKYCSIVFLHNSRNFPTIAL